jgi:hypothetical protein
VISFQVNDCLLERLSQAKELLPTSQDSTTGDKKVDSLHGEDATSFTCEDGGNRTLDDFESEDESMMKDLNLEQLCKEVCIIM